MLPLDTVSLYAKLSWQIQLTNRYIPITVRSGLLNTAHHIFHILFLNYRFVSVFKTIINSFSLAYKVKCSTEEARCHQRGKRSNTSKLRWTKHSKVQQKKDWTLIGFFSFQNRSVKLCLDQPQYQSL